MEMGSEKFQKSVTYYLNGPFNGILKSDVDESFFCLDRIRQHILADRRGDSPTGHQGYGLSDRNCLFMVRNPCS
jgi:hypothetical protein